MDDPVWTLVKAVQKEDLPLIRACLSQGCAVNDFRGGKTALMYSVHCSREVCKDVMDALIEAGADLSVEDAEARTAFMHAVISGLRTPISIFIEIYRVDPHAETSTGMTPVLQGIKHFKPRVMDQLIRHGVNMNTYTSTSITPLMFAIVEGLNSVVAYLVGLPCVDVNFVTPDGRSPLICASETDDRIQCISLLANAPNIDIDKENPSGMTALLVAVSGDHLLSIQALIAYGANVNRQSTTLGVTALYYAYELGSSRASDILLAHGADCSIRPGETGAFSKSLSPFPKQTNFGSRRCCNNSSECGVQ